MKQVYCNELAAHDGKEITSFFIVGAKYTRKKRNGELYLCLTLCDRTGTVEAKLWNDISGAADIAQDDFVKVRGTVSEYQNRYELAIKKIRKATDEEVTLSDFLPSTDKSIEVLWSELCTFIESIESLEIRRLLRAVLHDEEISGRFRRAPAAKNFHHAFLGGLLEHVVSLCTLCDLAHRNYTWLNRDLLIAGAVLHDIGKIYELAYDRTLNYTDRGQLIGHITIGTEILYAKASENGISPELLAVLEHLILSHHGQLEWGSPVEPLLPESLLLHLLDNADSKLQAIKQQLENSNGNAMWTANIPALSRRMMRLSTYLPEIGQDEPKG